MRKIVARTGKPPTVVGSGWGYFLTREGAKGTRLFLHEFQGRQPDAPQRWRSGTTIAAASKTLLPPPLPSSLPHPNAFGFTLLLQSGQRRVDLRIFNLEMFLDPNK